MADYRGHTQGGLGLDLSTMRGNFHSMDEIRRVNATLGHNWFSPDSMKWWNTRVGENLYAGHIFVTSDAPGHDGRAYTVRAVHADGSIGTVGDFMAYATRGAAHRAAATIARESQARGQYACPCTHHADATPEA